MKLLLCLLGIFKILSCASRKSFKDTIMEFKAHRAVVVQFRAESFDEIGVVITRMKLDEFNLFFLFSR